MFFSTGAGAQSDSEVSPHHPSEVSVDRGYTSDSEVYTEHSKTRIPRSLTDMDAASSGWLLVSTRTTLEFHFVALILKHLCHFLLPPGWERRAGG